MTKILSGILLEDAENDNMRIYGKRAGKRDSNGKKSEEPKFRMQDTATLLSTLQK